MAIPQRHWEKKKKICGIPLLKHKLINNDKNGTQIMNYSILEHQLIGWVSEIMLSNVQGDQVIHGRVFLAPRKKWLVQCTGVQ